MQCFSPCLFKDGRLPYVSAVQGLNILKRQTSIINIMLRNHVMLYISWGVVVCHRRTWWACLCMCDAGDDIMLPPLPLVRNRWSWTPQ